MWFHSPAWDEVDYWALDLETSGLDPKTDHMLAVAMVPVRRGVIAMAGAYRTLVRPPAGAAIPVATMRAHHIVPSELDTAPVLEQVLPEVLARLPGAALLVHHAPLDVGFLKAGCRRSGLAWTRVPVVDTVDLLWKRARRRRYLHPSPQGDPELNLADARRACGLPAYPAHDALTDAVATAELFLVLRHQMGARRLRELT
jgi:DNA polymerase-3 subunit epsilon